ncbi:5-hydroxytryptamine receptor 3A-like [Pempheris klunzingeri]|uniref:5-hydroxytryptamine receptor 3A-like n=1 Tax=Pempheris klunzingeri TaxID=3127111 RepID=UPI00397FBC00
MVRPVQHHETVTWVEIQMVIYAILDVREIDQTFISYTWLYVVWYNAHIWWNPYEFCNIYQIVVPSEALWRPDLIIEEMIEKDKAPPTPYLTISYYGFVHLRDNLVLISTCKMEVYKFPFDIQTCTLSFKSAVYSVKEILLEEYSNSSATTEWSREVMRTQSEWLFMHVNVSKKTVDYLGFNQSMLIYSVTMKRRSALYIANFMLPVLFFLCLDLASFLISDSGGEKLGFKVTVLLAVTVMQLILNEILPSSSDRIPLIAIYCIGSFGLMMLSLLETILVMYLIRKDSQDNEPLEDQSLNEKKWTDFACVCDVSAEETAPEEPSVTKEGSSSHLMEESHSLEKVSDELREVEKTLSLILNTRNEERKPLYWAGVVKTINKVFFIFYVSVATVFLTVLFFLWRYAEGE